ncbi:Uncharacterized protein Fot_18036 [Forsythia ovata]|uniref:Uncharacterized protein n=1 Tax=Forsythia ovata TaxID=205694 RepID=A0ABD1VJQ9_9LAMI
MCGSEEQIEEANKKKREKNPIIYLTSSIGSNPLKIQRMFLTTIPHFKMFLKLDPYQQVRDSANLEKASVQCRDESAGNDDDMGIFHNCGLLSNTLLPCLACAES